MIYAILELQISYGALVVYKGKQNIICFALSVSWLFRVDVVFHISQLIPTVFTNSEL